MRATERQRGAASNGLRGRGTQTDGVRSSQRWARRHRGGGGSRAAQPARGRQPVARYRPAHRPPAPRRRSGHGRGRPLEPGARGDRAAAGRGRPHRGGAPVAFVPGDAAAIRLLAAGTHRRDDGAATNRPCVPRPARAATPRPNQRLHRTAPRPHGGGRRPRRGREAGRHRANRRCGGGGTGRGSAAVAAAPARGAPRHGHGGRPPPHRRPGTRRHHPRAGPAAGAAFGAARR